MSGVRQSGVVLCCSCRDLVTQHEGPLDGGGQNLLHGLVWSCAGALVIPFCSQQNLGGLSFWIIACTGKQCEALHVSELWF